MKNYSIGSAHVYLSKTAQTHDISYSLSGRLQLSQTGWLVLTVPAAFVRGAFDALHEEGVELPDSFHIAVMSPSEIGKIGANKITERGHSFGYTLGPVRSHEPSKPELSKIWYIQIYSSELKKLRHSYGLEPYLKSTHSFQLPIAIRKTGAVVRGEITKSSEVFNIDDYDLEAVKSAACY